MVYLDLERFLDPAQSVRGGPVLFPITGGLPNNQLPLPQGTFTIGQHGFARQLPWQMEALADGIDLLVRSTGPVRLVDAAAGATLELQLSHPFDLVVLWTEPPRPMVCIEP